MGDNNGFQKEDQLKKSTANSQTRKYKFTSGDVVILKSGGVPLTVSKVNYYQSSAQELLCVPTYECQFMSVSERSGHEVKTVTLREDVLILAADHETHAQLQRTRLCEARLREVELTAMEPKIRAKASNLELLK